MKDFYRNNRVFWIPYVCVFIAISVVLILDNKSDIHLFINHFHTPFWDVFFKYLTFLGDGNFALIISLSFLLLYSFRFTFYMAFANLSAGIMTQFLKRVVFSELLRPSAYFKDNVVLHLVEGVKIHGKHSFPSGHAATAFAIFFCLAVLVKNKILKILFLLIAILVAFSRVYISQHFLIDIWAGSLIGVLLTVLFYKLIMQSKAAWLDKSLIKLIRHAGKK